MTHLKTMLLAIRALPTLAARLIVNLLPVLAVVGFAAALGACGGKMDDDDRSATLLVPLFVGAAIIGGSGGGDKPENADSGNPDAGNGNLGPTIRIDTTTTRITTRMTTMITTGRVARVHFTAHVSAISFFDNDGNELLNFLILATTNTKFQITLPPAPVARPLVMTVGIFLGSRMGEAAAYFTALENTLVVTAGRDFSSSGRYVPTITIVEGSEEIIAVLTMPGMTTETIMTTFAMMTVTLQGQLFHTPDLHNVVNAAMAEGFNRGVGIGESPFSFSGRYDGDNRAAGFTYAFGGSYALRTDYIRLPSRQDSEVWLDTYRFGALTRLNDETRFFAGIDNYQNAIIVMDTNGENGNNQHRLGFAIGKGYAIKYEYRLNL